MTGLTGAKNSTEEKPAESSTPLIKDVHIRVFFDGTNNNAVQLAIHDKIKAKNSQEVIVDSTTNIDESLKLKKEINNLNTDLSLLMNRTERNFYTISELEEMDRLRGEIEIKKEKLKEINLHPDLNTKVMSQGDIKGYSNVAILYSLLNYKKDNDTQLYYNIYVEGSGATDISMSMEKNLNGLGFGLGNTGVTALVSKAIHNIYIYLIGRVSQFNSNTNFHFYVFGFSRGATCARLFSHLTTREVGDILKREGEFGQQSSMAKSLMVNNRLPFMEPDFLHGNFKINRDNVTVEVLGIFDTVASIGFIKQHDGWTNKLSWAYRMWWFNNYRGNFHYTNARDYGLYAPKENKRIKKVIHICAADEFRENFALVNLGREIDPERHLEIVIPGCHSDIGGGYIDEVGMDCVVERCHPRDSKAKATLPLHNPRLPIGTVIEEQENLKIEEVGYLDKKTLEKLGWIESDDTKNIVEIDSQYKGKQYTMRYVEDNSNVHFIRRVLGGYSNIPLAMMLKFVEVYCSDSTLFKSTDKTYSYKKIKGLEVFGKKLEDLASKIGKRFWVIPENDNSGEFYRWLRLRYLHFTSSKSLMHFRLTTSEEKENGEGDISFDVDGENIGNPINYADNGRICRIMYDGEKELETGGHKGNVKYMPNMNSVTIIKN